MSLSYTIKRILSIVPILFIVSIVIFTIIYFTPGSPASQIIGLEATPQQIELINEKLGLNDSYLERYFRWIKGVVHLDLGRSYFMDEPISIAIKNHFAPTLSLAILAQIMALIFSIPLGILAAYKERSLLDRIVNAISLVGFATPSFITSLLLVIFFSLLLGVLPVAGYTPIWDGFIKHIRYLLLPAFALSFSQSALLIKLVRSSMIDVLEENYIKTAIIKGIPAKNILFIHAFKNTLLPIITAIGSSFGSLICGAIVVETIFNIPGFGQLLINSIERRDHQMIQGLVLTISVLYIVVNLIVDLLYGYIDPRVQIEGEKNEN